MGQKARDFDLSGECNSTVLYSNSTRSVIDRRSPYTINRACEFYTARKSVVNVVSFYCGDDDDDDDGARPSPF